MRYFRTRTGMTGSIQYEADIKQIEAIYGKVERQSIPFEKTRDGKLSEVAKAGDISIAGYNWDWIKAKQQGK